MSLPSRLTALTLGLALLAAAPAAGAAGTIVADGGFEGAQLVETPDQRFVTSSAWVGEDSEYASVLCRLDTCAPEAGQPQLNGPHTGSVWAFFGAGELAGHTGSLAQTVTIPQGGAILSYAYRASWVGAPYDATLIVAIDGTPVRTHTEPSTPDAAYSQQDVSISDFADGKAHALTLSYLSPSASGANLLVDDVSITAFPVVCTVSPSAVNAAQASVTAATAQVAAAEKKRAKVKKKKKDAPKAKVKKAKKRLKAARAELAAAQAALSAAQAAFAAANAACGK